ncbi:TIGR03936 family radical SAM-associated protein [Herbivorax sp. ANBcel31]|uniref:TIGR03936 family radical SAM-associated protein n=1 Tax=Herbivorax sp. ANBcel31 TaxID=3069754 RepID=UPI0027B1D507|nr:TIGR03936 family radical SAM-associated protein [Herbivorax sp. ANBcel31]MDQ2087296.1 TIGR03936 family radical SAM-associated protein [Herbivorax sp. ANBcel31]
MNSIRAKFVRGEEVKFISHLDLKKVFERALRRSGILIAYSKGFNPHPQMVFGLPLSVGVTSESEYIDLEFEEPIDVDNFMDRLNECLPKGIKVVEAKEKKEKTNIMASIAGASYEILVNSAKIRDSNDIKDMIDKFMDLEEIIIKKETKRKIKDINIRPMIYSIKAGLCIDGIDEQVNKEENYCCKNPWILKYIKTNYEDHIKFKGDLKNSLFCFSTLLSAGSSANLKPVFLVKALNNTFCSDFDVIKIHRTELFTGSADKFTNPLD